MKKDEVKTWIEKLVQNDELWKFYKSKKWINLKREILEENHYECAECKKEGKITRYDIAKDGSKKLISTVHHVQFVRKHPAEALSRTYEYGGKVYQNLIPVCKSCHNKLHPEKNKNRKRREDFFVNDERW